MNCYHCGKGVLMGRTHTHHRGVAGGRWKKRAPKVQRVFYANLQVANILVAGKVKRVKLCTRCLKRVKKDIADGVKPFVQLVANEPKVEVKPSSVLPNRRTSAGKEKVVEKKTPKKAVK